MPRQKLKRIKITNAERIAYCERENKMQFFVYKKKIENGKMTQAQANLNYQIIKELGELSAMLKEKGFDWYEIVDLVTNLKKK